MTLKIIIAAIQQATYACSNNISILHLFWDVTNFAVYVNV